jgi:hypothetical protein
MLQLFGSVSEKIGRFRGVAAVATIEFARAFLYAASVMLLSGRIARAAYVSKPNSQINSLLLQSGFCRAMKLLNHAANHTTHLKIVSIA